MVRHRSRVELDADLPALEAAPRDEGRLELIVRRPDVDEREVLDVGELDPDAGLAGDDWRRRAGRDGRSVNPDTQLTLMSTRAIGLIAPDRDRWPLAGDQLYVDLSLAGDNLPPGTRLAVGDAELEISPVPHRGCGKFVERFGLDAMTFVNSAEGRRLNLRGIYAKVVRAGRVRAGDVIAVVRRARQPEAP